MICDVHYSYPRLLDSHDDYVKRKLIEEIASRGESSLRTTRGLRLALRNLKRTIREETREGKEFFDYVTPPNGRGEYEAILYTKMWVVEIQAFWCEDTLEEEYQKWEGLLNVGVIPRRHHRVQAVAYDGAIVSDSYAAIRILLRVES